MAGVLGPNSGYPQSPPPPIWPLASEDLAVFRLVRLFCGTWKITSQTLSDQSHAGPYIWENAAIPPHFGPFWAYSRTLPQGVELLV